MKIAPAGGWPAILLSSCQHTAKFRIYSIHSASRQPAGHLCQAAFWQPGPELSSFLLSFCLTAEGQGQGPGHRGWSGRHCRSRQAECLDGPKEPAVGFWQQRFRHPRPPEGTPQHLAKGPQCSALVAWDRLWQTASCDPPVVIRFRQTAQGRSISTLVSKGETISPDRSVHQLVCCEEVSPPTTANCDLCLRLVLCSWPQEVHPVTARAACR